MKLQNILGVASVLFCTHAATAQAVTELRDWHPHDDRLDLNRNNAWEECQRLCDGIQDTRKSINNNTGTTTETRILWRATGGWRENAQGRYGVRQCECTTEEPQSPHEHRLD